MDRQALDHQRAARLATVQSELADKLGPVRGSMSDDKFARTLSLLARELERAEYNATRGSQRAEFELIRHTSRGSE